MADTKISALTTTTSLTGAELIPLVQAGVTVNASAATIANQLPASGVAAGSYTNANITVNAKGQVTAAANGTGGGGGITALTGDVTASGSGSVAATLATSGVSAGSYTNANITVDAKGRVTSAASGTTGATPGGTSGQVQVNNSGALGGITVSGDGTLNTSTGALTITKINGVTPGSANGVATLDGAGKLSSSQIPAAIAGGLNYQGLWNASTNSPTLASGTGTKGYLYKVGAAGTTTLDGISSWNVGDELYFDGAYWEKLDGITSEVLSVAGRTGTVTLSATDIANLGQTPGPVVAQIGDSFGSNGVSSSGNLAYINSGFGTWARILTGQRVQFPIANQLGVGGTTLSTILSSLASALALKPAYLIINGGTNDLAGTSLASMKSSISSIVQQALNAGVIPIVCPITPRNDSFTVAKQQKAESYNRYLMELCAGRQDLAAAAGIPAYVRAYCLDISMFFDYTSTTGGYNAGLIESAGLHPSQGGGLVLGAQVADIINMTSPPSPTYMTTPYDLYDATNNISGSLLGVSGVNEGMLRGTAGSLYSQNGVTPTGVLAGMSSNAFQALRASGTSTATMACAKEDPRTDGLATGARQRITINSTSTGSPLESYSMKFINGSGAGITAGFAAGDQVVFQCAYQIANAVHFAGVSANLAATGGGGLVYSDGLTYSNQVPGVSSATYPDLLRVGVLRTPPMTIAGGVTNLIPSFQVDLNATNSGSAIDVFVSDWKVFKLV